MKLALTLGAALLAASTALYAQGDDKAARREAMKDAHQKAMKACEGKKDDERRACLQTEMCKSAKDPKACQERVAKARDHAAKARKVCESKPESERRECMRRELCAQSKDPAKCEAAAKEAQAKRQKIQEACKDKKGDDYRACVREQRAKK